MSKGNMYNCIRDICASSRNHVCISFIASACYAELMHKFWQVTTCTPAPVNLQPQFLIVLIHQFLIESDLYSSKELCFSSAISTEQTV